MKPVNHISFGLDAPSVDDPLMVALAPTITQQLVRWNGMAFEPVKEIICDPEGSLIIKGDFIEEDIAQLRERISKSG